MTYIYADIVGFLSFNRQIYMDSMYHHSIVHPSKDYKTQIKIQSVLYEDTVCLKGIIVVWRSSFQRCIEQLSSNCYCLRKGWKQRNNKLGSCCCLPQVVNSGTQNIVRIVKKLDENYLFASYNQLYFKKILKGKNIKISFHL